MKKFLALLMFASQALADGVGGGFAYMYDSDSNSWFNASSMYMATDTLGVRYGKTQYHTASVDDSADRLSLLVDYKSDYYSIVGEVGGSKLGDKTFVIGDITAHHAINKNLQVFIGADGDVVDSEFGVAKQITYQGWNTGVEVFNDKFGATALVRETYFSDNNTRFGYMFRTFFVPTEGISVYVSTKSFDNSQGTTDYFSPTDLRRNSLGVTYRYAIKDLIVSGYAEVGYQETPDFNERANAFKISISSGFSKLWKWRLSYVTDLESTSNYRYNLVSGEVFLPL
jgi:hypothetical protein